MGEIQKVWSTKSNIEANIIHAQELNASLTSNLQEWKSTNEIIEKEILEAQQLYPEFVQNLSDWQSTNNQIQHEIERLESENASLRHKYEDLNSSNQQLNKPKSGDEILSLQFDKSQINSLNDEISQLKTEIEVHKQANSEMQIRIEDLHKNQSNDLDSQLKYQNLLNLKNEMIDKLELEIDNLRKEKPKAEAVKEETDWGFDEDSSTDFQIKVNELEQENDELKRKIDDLNTEILNLKTSFEEDLAVKEDTNQIELQIQEGIFLEAKNKLDSLQKEAEKLNNESIETQTLNETLISNLNAWKQANVQVENEILNQQELNSTLLGNLNAWQENNKQLEASLNEKQKESKSDLEKESNELEEQVKLLESKKDELLNKKQTVEVEIDALENDIKQLEEALLNNQSLNSELSTNLNAWLTSNKQIECAILEAQKLNTSLAQNNEQHVKVDSVNNAEPKVDNEEHLRTIETYRNLVSSQRALIVKMEKRHTDILTSLFDSLNEEGSTYVSNVDEIQGDLANLLSKLSEIQGFEPCENPLKASEVSPLALRSLKSFIMEYQDEKNAKLNESFKEIELENSFDEMFARPTELLNEAKIEIDDEHLKIDIESSINNLKQEINEFENFDMKLQETAHEDLVRSAESVNHLKEIFKNKPIFDKSDFECQCDLINTEKENMYLESIESNKSMYIQLESKVNEIKNLNSFIKSLEENESKLVQDIDELRSANEKLQTQTEFRLSNSLTSSVISRSVSPKQFLNSSKDGNDYDSQEINSLEDLIENYLNLIKSYKFILAKLEEVNFDHSQLKVSYNYLNSKYLKLRSQTPSIIDNEITEVNDSKAIINSSPDTTNDWTKDEIVLDVNNLEKEVESNQAQIEADNQNYISLIEKKYEQQLNNLKFAYNSLCALYASHKDESFKNYNKLHEEYLKLSKAAPTSLNDKNLLVSL